MSADGHTASPNGNENNSNSAGGRKQWINFENGDANRSAEAGGFAEASEQDVEALNQSSSAAEMSVNLGVVDGVGGESETDSGPVIDATQVEVKVVRGSSGSEATPVKLAAPPRHSKSPVSTEGSDKREEKTRPAAGKESPSPYDSGDSPGMTLHPIPLETRTSDNTYENGQLLASVGPTNERWAWITSARFNPEAVPPELMTPSLSITADDYSMCMDFLTNDYRFACYTMCYRRLILSWLVLGFTILLGVLFAGEKGIVLFGIGVCWLIINACGIVACLYIKSKINKNLEVAVASVNRILMRHKILVGMEDAGKISCHKIYLHFIYYDCSGCLTWLDQQIAEKRRKALRKHARDNEASSASQAQAGDRNSSNMQNGGSVGETEVHVDDTVDIVGNFSETNRQHTTRLEHAEHILLSYSQVYVKNLCRELLVLRSEVPEGLEAHRPRHLKGHYCLCQYVEQNLFRLKPPKWYASFV